ncbi:hypothetical protein V2G26_016342 [Clonostachys chloroleuca]
MRLHSITSAALCLAGLASAAFMRGNGIKVGPIDETVQLRSVSSTNQSTTGWGTFEQLLDHNDPSQGTFSQRFWYGIEHWKGPGSPIFMVNPGEQAGTNFNKTYTTTARLPGLFAQELGGAVIILEHRYWGESSPFEELTVANLTWLTLEQSIKDNVYFAKNFNPPFDTTGGSKPDKAPWVFSGGSYSGALAGWLAALEPGTFWAYHGTSGVVEIISDFWQYFTPVLEATPKNCSRDINDAIEYIDHVLLHGNTKQKHELKDKFLLADLSDADFASALEYGPWQWQSTQFYSEKVNGFNSYYRFCDYVENVWPNSTNKVPGAHGVGRAKAIEGYAKWFKEELLPGNCEASGYDDWQGTYNTGCFANQNSSNIIFKDLSPGNWGNRQWNWMLCNDPLKYWQTGAPKGQPTLVSRLVNVEYWESQCKSWFPEGGYGIEKGKTEADVNRYTGGWFAKNTTRLMDTNGQRDPWRDVTVSSIYRPGGPLESTPEHPVRVVPGGVHCPDYYGQNWEANAEVKKIAYDEVENMREWVKEFYEQ